MPIDIIEKKGADTGTSADKLIVVQSPSNIPNITGIVDANARTNLVYNKFEDNIDEAADTTPLSNGWIDVFTDESDIEGVTNSSKIQMVRFDGSNDYLTIADATLGNSDGKSYLFSVWWDATNSTDGAIYNFMHTAISRFRIYRNSSNEIHIFLRNSVDTTIADIQSTNTITSSDGLTHILIGFDMANQTIQIRINGGSVETNQVTTAIANDTIDWTDGDNGLMGSNTGVSKMKGDIGQFYIAEEYIDISDDANLALFIDANGNPVDLGSDGSGPTGTAPLIYLNDGILTGVNAGSGGNFTVNGELVDAGTLTVGPSEVLYDSTNDLYEPSYEIIDSYGKENENTIANIYTGFRELIGQAITLSTASTLSKITVSLRKVGSPTGTVNAQIMGATGTIGTSGQGDNSVLAISDGLDVSTLGTGGGQYPEFSFPEPVPLSSGDYVIALVYNGGDVSNHISISIDTSSPTHSGNFVDRNGTTWSPSSTVDLIFYLYGLKNFDLITRGSDDIGNSPLTDPIEGHIQALIEEQPAGGTISYNGVASDSESGTIDGYTFRTIVPAANISTSGNRIRITLTGSTTTTTSKFDNVAIVQRSGNTAHGIEMPTEILFGGSSGIEIPLGGTVVSDWVDFELDSTKDHLLIYDMPSSGGHNLRRVTTGGRDVYYTVAANSYNTAAMPATITSLLGWSLWDEQIEVESKQVLDTDIIAEMSRDGGTTYSPATLSRTPIGVTGSNLNIIRGDVDFTGDPSGTNIKARIRTVNKDKIKVKAISPNWNS